MKTIRASSAGFPCNRKIWYEVNSVIKREKVDSPQQRIFDTGTCLEALVVDFLRRDGWTVNYNPGSQNAQIEFTCDLTGGQLAGHPDCFMSKGEMQNVLADIKTFNDRAFRLWKQQGTLKGKPQYADQLHVYAGLALKAGYTVEHLAIVGFNKNNSEMYIDIFDYEPARFEAICERSQEILNSETAPVEGCKREAWSCRYCDYAEICDLSTVFQQISKSISDEVIHTKDGQIISAMDLLLAGREYSRAGAAMEKEAKAILDAKVFSEGIRNIQGGNYTLNITEKPRTAFDSTAFKKAHPELVSSFTKTSTSIYYEVGRLDGVNEE